jgi:probable F420-dependent oxidoreductase
MNLSRLGICAHVGFLSAPESAAFARRIEQWGYGTLWIPEITARDPFISSSWLLANTTHLNLATGIASIHSRDPYAATNSQYGLAEQSQGRFLLGLGVSHAPFVEGVLGHRFEKPALQMQRYLEGMRKMTYLGPQPASKPKTVLGALGPRMLEVARDFADGAHPYNVTPNHTATARSILGPGKLLCPEQMVVLEPDASTARAIARNALALSFKLPNYRNNYLRLGFDLEDLESGGSDRLIDAIVAWGDEKAIRQRIQEHWDAGADHVCIQPLRRSGARLTPEDEKILEVLAPGG